MYLLQLAASVVRPTNAATSLIHTSHSSCMQPAAALYILHLRGTRDPPLLVHSVYTLVQLHGRDSSCSLACPLCLRPNATALQGNLLKPQNGMPQHWQGPANATGSACHLPCMPTKHALPLPCALSVISASQHLPVAAFPLRPLAARRVPPLADISVPFLRQHIRHAAAAPLRVRRLGL